MVISPKHLLDVFNNQTPIFTIYTFNIVDTSISAKNVPVSARPMQRTEQRHKKTRRVISFTSEHSKPRKFNIH